MRQDRFSLNKLARILAAALLTLSMATVSFAGGVDGPTILRNRIVNAYSSRLFTVMLRAGEPASIEVKGDGSTDLDLFIYDDRGNLITSDAGPSDKCIVYLDVFRTSTFTLKVVNRGYVYNQFDIWTD